MKYLALVVLAFVLLLVVPAGAAEYYDGYTTSGGWTWHSGDGYWWKDGQAYTRQLVTTPGYYCNYYYYQGSSYWQYTRVNYTPKTAQTVPYTKDWKSKVLEVAAARDDHNAYLQTIKALGLPLPPDQGPVPGGGYGYGYRSASSALYSLSGSGSSFQLGTYGANGQTIYGYQQAVAQPYGTLDLNGLYQQAARLTQTAQGLAGDANRDFSGLVGQAGQNQARVAEILAQAEAAAKALNAARGPAITTQQSSTFQLQANPVAPPVPASAPPGPPAPVGPLVPAPGSNPVMPRVGEARAAFNVLLQSRCASCHSGKKLEGGFDIAAWPKLDGPARAKVLARLTTADKEKRMPLGKPALTPDEIKLFLMN